MNLCAHHRMMVSDICISVCSEAVLKYYGLRADCCAQPSFNTQGACRSSEVSEVVCQISRQACWYTCTGMHC